MSKTYPAFQTYPLTEMTDERRTDWSTWQWGCFCRLRQHAWCQSNQGKFLAVDAKLKKVVGFGTADPQKEKEFREVLTFFKRVGKYYVDTQLVDQLKSMQKFSSKQSRKARRRWKNERDDKDPGYLPTAKEVRQNTKIVVWEGREMPWWELKDTLKLLDQEIQEKKAELQKHSPGTDSHNICYI
jgi:hypothetical protein